MTTIEQPPQVPAIELAEAPCPLCRCDQHVHVVAAVDNLYEVAGSFHAVRCERCAHVYMNPMPTDASLALCYPEIYGPHQGVDVAATSPTPAATGIAAPTPWYLTPWGRRIPGLRRLYYWLIDQQAELIPDVDGTPSALELGCATGQFLSRLAARGWRVRGVELVEGAANQAIARGHDVHLGTLETAPLDGASFDAVFAWMVLEHVPRPRETVARIRRLLEPGGYFVFSIPNFACWERHFFGRFWHALELPRHLQQFTPASITKLLQSEGFQVEQISHHRNLLNIVGSMGIVLRRSPTWRRLGQRFLDYCERPTLWMQLATAPLAKLLAVAHQSGRLTVVARRLEHLPSDGAPSDTSTR